jgi:hypothetical protein
MPIRSEPQDDAIRPLHEPCPDAVSLLGRSVRVDRGLADRDPGAPVAERERIRRLDVRTDDLAPGEVDHHANERRVVADADVRRGHCTLRPAREGDGGRGERREDGEGRFPHAGRKAPRDRGRKPSHVH